MKTAIIIEDELDAQVLLQAIVEDFCPTLKIISVASNYEEGKNQIISHCPDIVFLDIQLGTNNGFNILDEIQICPFKLIVTTAFKEYALEAFNHDALAYLLKPYSPKSVVAAVNRTLKIIEDRSIYNKLNSLVDSNRGGKISLPVSEGFIVLNIEDVVNVEADRSYCLVNIECGKKVMVSKPLKEIEQLLPDSLFFRSHTSHLINLKYLMSYNKEDGGFAIMSNDKHIPISRRKKTEFIGLLKSGLLSLY